MYRRQNIIILVLIIIIFVVGVVPIFREDALPLAFFLVGVVLFAAAQERSPKFKELVNRTYGWFIISFILVGSLLLLRLAVRGEIPLDVSLIAIIPIAILIALFIAFFLWVPVLLNRFISHSTAEQHYTNLLRLHPRFWFAYQQRALLKQQRGDVDGAIADYEKALEFAEANPLTQSSSCSRLTLTLP